MQVVKAEDWEHDIKAIKIDLGYHFWVGREDTPELDRAADWIETHGLSVSQFLALLWAIGLPEVLRLSPSEMQIVHALGVGVRQKETSADDIPF